VADRLDDLFAAVNPSVAFLIRDMEVRVRISAKAEDQETARLLIAPIEEEIRARLGAAVFAVDGETVEDLIVDRLGSLGWAVGTKEQATLGQVGARIAEHDRSRSVFAGTVIVGREDGEATPPIADVVLTVGPIGGEVSPGRRITRAVEMTVTTPDRATTRVFDLGGDDERVRSFATIAGLHLIRTAVESPDGGT
jgi:nicotinamide-nucleotide amidase